MKSFWLQAALASSLKRDPVDALNDAEALVAELQANLETLVAQGAAALALIPVVAQAPAGWEYAG